MPSSVKIFSGASKTFHDKYKALIPWCSSGNEHPQKARANFADFLKQTKKEKPKPEVNHAIVTL